MSRVRGRSFKITKNQARGYGYAKPGKMRRNPGVTTIAAINGRGSYGANRSARSVMSKLKKNARPAVARKRLTAAQKAAFKARMARARAGGGRPTPAPTGLKRRRQNYHIRPGTPRASHEANRSTSSAQSASSKRNIRKAQRSRKAWGSKLSRGKRVRVGRASYGRKPKARRLKAGVYIANRRKKAGSKTMARRRKKAAKATKKRRSSKRRRKTTLKTSAPKRRRRRKARKGAARKRTTARKTVRRRRRRLKANAAPKRRRRKSRKAASDAPKRRKRRSKARRGTRRRKTSRKRRGAPRRRRVSRRRRKGSRKLKANGRRRRRSHRRNKGGMKTNRRRRSHRRNKSHKANRRRRSHRRNGRKLFRMNGAGDMLKMGAVLFGGFALHRLLTNLVSNQVLSRLLPAPAPVATSGFSLSENRGLIASIAVGALGSFLASKVIKNQETKKLVIGGMVASTIHGVVLSLMKSFMPAQADMLAGPEDGTAARLSAMYGMGGGASIMPRYGMINGMGEYFREPMNGLGEYFREPMNGIGEYIAATNGIGTYEQNSDLMQAAAGFGNHDYQGNHIDPSSDLDRQLTIAEAAAGVGSLSPFEAAAGIGPMQAAAGFGGFGAIDTVPSGDTWIPGSVNPQLWAGVRAVTNPQSATEMVPAGTLQSDGGSGIFG